MPIIKESSMLPVILKPTVWLNSEIEVLSNNLFSTRDNIGLINGRWERLPSGENFLKSFLIII